MYPSDHIIFGLLFSIALYVLFPGIGAIGALLVFLSSVAGDVDHYALFVLKKKNFSLKKAYFYFVTMREDIISGKVKQMPLLFFHTIEFVALLIIFSFLWDPLFCIAIGVLFHLFLDFIDVTKMNKQDTKCFSFILCKIKKS